MRARDQAHLAKLVERTGSTLGMLVGLDTRSVAELLIEIGDPADSPRAVWAIRWDRADPGFVW